MALNRNFLDGTGLADAKDFQDWLDRGVNKLSSPVTVTTAVLPDRAIQVDSSGNIEPADGTGLVIGINNTGMILSPGKAGFMTVVDPEATITLGGKDLAAPGVMVAVPGGCVAPFNTTLSNLMNAVQTTATDDFTAGAFTGGEKVDVYTSDIGHHGKKVTVCGYAPTTLAFISEEVTLANPSTGAVTTTATFAEVVAVYNASAIAVHNLLLDTHTTANNIVTLATPGATTWYGRILTDVADDAKGHDVWVSAGAAGNTGKVVVAGTANGDVQYKTITMNGTTPVATGLSWDTVLAIYAGADNVAWNDGNKSKYTINVAADSTDAVVGKVVAAAVTAGETTTIIFK